MNNDDDSNNLSELWHSQSVSQIDMTELKRQWKTTRIKQFCYLALDLGGIVAVVLILYFLPRKLAGFEMISMGIAVGLLAIWVAYLVWLRRFSLGFISEQGPTKDYVELIKTQYRQNIKIARLNKNLTYVFPILFVTFFYLVYSGELIEPEALIRKLTRVIIVLVIFLPANWVWANKREQKFTKALAEFDTKF